MCESRSGGGPRIIEVHNALPNADGKYRSRLIADDGASSTDIQLEGWLMTRESKTSPRSPVAFENVFNAELRARNRERRAGFRRLAAAEAAGGPCRNDPLPPLGLVEIRLDDLKLAARRLRKRDPAHVREIANAIARLGYSRPILVGRDNEVIDGESVVGAVRLLGFDRLTCVRVDHLSASEQRVLRLAINRLAEKGCQTASNNWL